LIPSNPLVVFPLTHHLIGSLSQNIVGASSRNSQSSSAAAPQDIEKDSAPTKKGQFVFTGWNDHAKRELFMWKVKRKKGYAFFLHLFPGETAESLHEAFKKYSDDGERLYNGQRQQEWGLA
jgi:hypothetical protein